MSNHQSDMIEYESFFDNAGIDNLIATGDQLLEKYETVEADEVSTVVEADVAQSLTLLTEALRDLKALSGLKKKEALSPQIQALRRMIKAHQALLRSYSSAEGDDLKELSKLIHALNILYPLFVIGLVFEENSQSNDVNPE